MEKMVTETRSSLIQNFWTGKRVFLTGHTGFKGSWLSIWLHAMGAKVFGYALAPSITPSLFNESKIVKHITSTFNDIRNFENVVKAIKDAEPDILIHMAAQPLVRYSYHHPIETYTTNVIGTVNVLEAARQVDSIKAIINVATDKCYENNEWLWGYREDEPLGGHDPYSSSKACSELVTSAYRRSYFAEKGIALASARAGNVIGGGDWSEDRLIPDILRSFERNQPVIIRNPQAIRPWQHVLEPLSGYLMLAEKLYENGQEFAEAWNFGPLDQDAKSVEWIVNKLSELLSNQLRWSLDESSNPHEAHYLKLDISKAKHDLGWSPVWDLETALDKIVDWHQHWKEDGDLISFSEKQIDQYIHHSTSNL